MSTPSTNYGWPIPTDGGDSDVWGAELVTTLTDIDAQVFQIANQSPIDTQAASYTLVLADAGSIVELNSGSANNLTVPPNSSVAFPVGTRIDLLQYGGGQTTVVAGAGVTIRSASGNLKLIGQYYAAALYKRATDEWVLIGALTT